MYNTGFSTFVTTGRLFLATSEMVGLMEPLAQNIPFLERLKGC